MNGPPIEPTGPDTPTPRPRTVPESYWPRQPSRQRQPLGQRQPSGQPQPSRPPLAAGDRLARFRELARRTSVLIAVAAAVGCPVGALAGGLGLFHWYGQNRPGEVAQVWLSATVIVAGHAATTAAAWARRLPRREVVLTQVPYLLTYVLVLVWNFGYRFAPGYIAWAAALLVVLSWLTVWYLRGARQARRALVYLLAVAVLAVGNGGGAVLVGWRQTNGFGLVGQGTPWDAMAALIGTSCLSTLTAYTSGSRTLLAHCPSGAATTEYTGAYDEGAFNQQLCSEQPRAAFGTWWERIRTYRVWISLDFSSSPQWQITVDGKPAPFPRPRQISGNSADISLTVRLANAARPGDLPPVQKYPMRANKDNEQWHVTAKRTLLGGWKVCTIEVTDPIQVTAATG